MAYVIQYQKCSQAVSFSKTIQKSICQIPFRRAIGPLLLLLLLHTDVCPPQFPITDLRAKREGEKETERDRQTVYKKELYCFQVAFPCAFVGIQQRQFASHLQREPAMYRKRTRLKYENKRNKIVLVAFPQFRNAEKNFFFSGASFVFFEFPFILPRWQQQIVSIPLKRKSFLEVKNLLFPWAA